LNHLAKWCRITRINIYSLYTTTQIKKSYPFSEHSSFRFVALREEQQTNDPKYQSDLEEQMITRCLNNKSAIEAYLLIILGLKNTLVYCYMTKKSKGGSISKEGHFISTVICYFKTVLPNVQGRVINTE